MKDPKWIFMKMVLSSGLKMKAIINVGLSKNRVNKDILLSYCTKLGFAITEAKFWESRDAIYLNESIEIFSAIV